MHVLLLGLMLCGQSEADMFGIDEAKSAAPDATSTLPATAACSPMPPALSPWGGNCSCALTAASAKAALWATHP